MATELEFYVFRETFDSAKARNYQDLERFGWYNEDYRHRLS
jgi:glutamine synthetase